MNLTEYIQ